MSQEPETAESYPSQGFSKTGLILIVAGILILTGSASAGGWLYYSWRLQDIPPFPQKTSPPARAVAAIALAPQPPSSPSAPSEDETPILIR